MKIKIKLKKLSTISEKSRGLSFTTQIKPVFFETRWGIHTFFVKKPIDILICDNNFSVNRIIRNLKPWRILFWNPAYNRVIELPANDKKYINIKVGDVIKIS